jgi:hypothetical protein
MRLPNVVIFKAFRALNMAGLGAPHGERIKSALP